MTTNPEQASNLDDAVEAFLDAKQKGDDSGNYRALAANVLGHWSVWLHNRDIGGGSSLLLPAPSNSPHRKTD